MKRKLIYTIFFGSAILLATSGTVNAQMQYQLLEQFPGFFNAGSVPTLPEMVLAIYKFGIWTVGIAGLFMLTVGGFWYMTSAGNNATAETAKKIIADSLLGIVAALGAYVIMYEINPDLVKINLTFTKTAVEPPETSAESEGTLKPATAPAGSCMNLETRSGIDKQCSEASPELTKLIGCVAGKLPKAIITSITDSRGYANCIPGKWTDPVCAHGKNSCHYGGRTCYNTGKSYAVDFSTSNINGAKLVRAAVECGVDYKKDEGNHVHMSVGSNCGCN